MLLPNGIWFLLATIPMWVGLACFAQGKPGGGQIKSTLIRSAVIFAVLQWLQAMVFIYEHNGFHPPARYMLSLILGALVMQLSWTEHFYAVAEREKGLHFTLSIWVCVLSLIATLIVPALQIQVTSLPLLGFNMLFLQSGSMWILLKSHRQAAPNSTRRKRLNYIFIALAITTILFIPIQVVAPSMGWLTDKILTFCLAQFVICSIIVLIYREVVLRFNLVKVELDQIGEGLFRDSDSPVVLLSKEYNILRLNPKATALFEHGDLMLKEEKKRPITEILPDFDHSRLGFDVVLNTVSGRREFECKRSNVYQMDEELGSLIVFHDMTKERELARMKTDFTSTVSHELRTPLTSILGFAKIIDKRLSEVILPKFTPEGKKEQRAVKQVNKNLGVIISESNRLTALINDVLDISKIEAGRVDWKFSTCDPYSFIEQAISATNGLFTEKPSVQLVQNIPDTLPEVVVDSDRIVQVIINLLSNAVKFTDAGNITVSTKHNWSSLSIAVKDTGAGITPADQKLVFEKYKQVGEIDNDKPKGTGLGLPISKEIVEYHGGRIWVESVVGEGSTFAFSLPLAAAIDASKSTVGLSDLKTYLEKRRADADKDNQTILIIDDEAHIREALKQILSDEGFQIREAADGAEGLAVVKEQVPSLIILDVMMPRMNGFDFAAAIKADQLYRHVPILMLTVFDDPQRAYGIGVEAYLTKPFEPQVIIHTVKDLLLQKKKNRGIVTLGSKADSDCLQLALKESDSKLTHVEDVSQLSEVIENEAPSLIIILDKNSNDFADRLDIQRRLGNHPCMVFYYDPT